MLSAAQFALMFAALTNLRPFFGLGCHVGAELGGREDKRRHGEIVEALSESRVGKAGVDLPVEPRDDLGRRAPWDADAREGDRFVSRKTSRRAWAPLCARSRKEVGITRPPCPRVETSGA
jgi:hypothetical protein